MSSNIILNMSNKLIILNENSDVKEISTKNCIENILELLLSLKKNYIRDNRIDYSAIRDDAFFSRNRRVIENLNAFHVSKMLTRDNDRRALYINLYNMLTVHVLSTVEPQPQQVSSMEYTHRFAYLIGGSSYTLNDILHALIRVNRPPPMSKKPPMTSGDLRLVNSVGELDARVHFAITNGAKDSPKFDVYFATKLDEQLTKATRFYLNHYLRAVVQHREIIAPKILHWYEHDFGKNDLLAVMWSLDYLESEKANDLRSLIRTMEKEGAVDLNYMPFDWSLNN